jgi:hypothetical protein
MLTQWTRDQLFCTACSLIVLLGFVALAFYLVPQEPPEGTFTDRCKAIARENYESKSNQSNPGSKAPGAERQLPTPPSTASNQSDENAQVQREIAAYTCELAAYTASVSSFTKLLVLVTVFVVFVGIVQGYWLYAAVRESAKQHATSNKAFVFLRYFFYTPTGMAKAVEYWRITPVFENNGNTATKRMISGHSALLTDKELPPKFDFPDTRFPPDGQPFFLSRDLIGPHAQINGAPYILSIEEILAIRDGKKKFYIWGWSDYDDIFEGTERHRTEYCYQLAILYDPRNPNNTAALGMGLYGNFNNVDGECRRPPAPYIPP